MTRIQACFTALHQSGRKALVTYIVAGDPAERVTVDLMHAMVGAGASLIELGFPFSDPEAEGPVIQQAHERALAHGTSLQDAIDMVAEFRRTDDATPIVLMGYVNPIEVMGYKTFAQKASAAGVDGTILVNLPPEEAEVPERIFGEYHIDTVYLLAPTTTPERAKYICEKSKGFVYYVSLKGVTGASTLDIDDARKRVAGFERICALPMVVGFGIKDGNSAVAVASMADGVAVGSAIVNIMGENRDDPGQMIEKVSTLVGDMRAAMDADANC